MSGAIHLNITHTCEREQESRLPFLDILIHNANGKFKFSWYHKDSWSGQYLHYNSFVPLNWKKGLLKGMAFLNLNICSPEFPDAAVRELRRAFVNNG